MITQFQKAAQEKFDKGAKEHQQEWSLSGIDVRAEIMGELLDLYNYGTLLETKQDIIQSEIGRALTRLSLGYWEQLQDTIPENQRIVEAKTKAERGMFNKLKNMVK